MRVSRVVIHDGARDAALARAAASGIAGARHVGYEAWEDPGIAHAAVRDAKMPPGRQPASGDVILYDGLAVQAAFAGAVGPGAGRDSLHVVISDVLLGTFDPGTYRYHARALVASNPAVISVPGITEAPARPRQYYVDAACMGPGELEARYRGSYLAPGDPGIAGAAATYVLQALAYHETGEAFCDDPGCRLYNAHWQSELMSQSSARPCKRHAGMLGIFT